METAAGGNSSLAADFNHPITLLIILIATKITAIAIPIANKGNKEPIHVELRRALTVNFTY